MAIWGLALMAAQGLYKGQQQKKEYQNVSQNALFSSEALGLQAQDVKDAAVFDELRWRKEGQRRLSEMESLFADAGVGLEGMTMDALLDAQREVELDALLIRRRGTHESEQLEVESRNRYEESEDAKKAARRSFFSL